MEFFLNHAELLLLFFAVALLYSSVGFGGGSSYLAILALYSFEFTFLRAVALLCNITVVSNGTWQYYRKRLYDFRRTLPLVLASVPMAYLGGMIKLEAKTFFIVLGFTLLLAAVAVWFRPSVKIKENNSLPHRWGRVGDGVLLSLFLGSVIGFISGMVGIGGGIFLSPLLYLINWDEPKRISAVASLFILVNSVSGLLGQFQSGVPDFDLQLAFGLLVSVAVGGFIGNYLGIMKFKPIIVRRATAILIAYVSVQLLVKYLL
ncbi:MAG: sulfite exporter TauE/SafE family protein [Spirosomaceae bacterium]|nr:sulfite exporter TauE/SafE family protein [Spirosomataceae bacterium]